jgi:hypothetical protein
MAVGTAFLPAAVSEPLPTDSSLRRHQRLFDVGLILGPQVKIGEEFLREPVRDSPGEITG